MPNSAPAQAWLRAVAAPAQPRLLLFFTPHGTVWDQWRPGGGEADFTFSPILKPLEKHRSRLVIVDGIEIKSGTAYYIPHTYTMPVLWTGSPIDTATSEFCRDDHMQCFGWNTGVSVDQYIAGKLGGVPTPYSTLELGLGCGGLHPATRMIYSAPGMPRSPIDKPEVAFNTLFGTISPDQELSHDSGPDAQGKLAKLYTWYSERFAYLLDRLAATPDVDGRSVLDNTLVIWGSELGRAWDHDISNVPFVFAGATDLLRSGRYLKGSVISHNRVLVSACHAMGLKDQKQYGTLDTGEGPVPGLFI